MTLPSAGGRATPNQLAAAKQVRADRAAELERVRTAAAKWQAGLAGLLAISLGLSVPSLGTTIRELNTFWSVVVAALSVAATSFAVASGFAALHASGGFPSLRGTTVVGSEHRDAVAAASSLRRAVGLGLVALGLAACVCLVAWFSPRKADQVVYAQVQSGTRTVCGQVDSKSVPGQLLVTTKSKTVEVVALDRVTSWVLLDRCP